jgi:transposase
MTMHPQPNDPVHVDTAQVARGAFPNGNVFIQMRDVLGSVYADEDFAEFFAARGRPAMAPGCVASVTVMQFAERLSDWQAAEAVRVRFDWT